MKSKRSKQSKRHDESKNEKLGRRKVENLDEVKPKEEEGKQNPSAFPKSGIATYV